MKQRSHPAGKSLIEMLVMISILSIVMGLSATSLAALFRVRHTITRDTELAASIQRLSMRLRTDAHEAVSVSLLNDGTRSVPTTGVDRCIFAFADGLSIQYTFAAPRIVREVRRGEQVVHRDSFLLPRHTNVAFASDKVGTGSLVRLVIKPEQTRLPPRELPRSATIEAAVGPHGVLAINGGRP